MADVGKTIVYPAKGVTLYLPGGVHGFTDPELGVPLRSDHAELLAKTGSLETAEQRRSAKGSGGESDPAAQEPATAVPGASG